MITKGVIILRVKTHLDKNNYFSVKFTQTLGDALILSSNEFGKILVTVNSELYVDVAASIRR